MLKSLRIGRRWPGSSATSGVAPADAEPDALADLKRWAAAEFRPWSAAEYTPDAFAAVLRQDLAKDRSLFHFTVEDGSVTFQERSAASLQEHFHGLDYYNILRHRALLYADFLTQVVAAFELRGTADFLVDLDDRTDHVVRGPTFRFQKTHGARSMLLPDIDFLLDGYYLDPAFSDDVATADKIDRAIFTGSTTGQEDLLTVDVVSRLAHQRLRSAVHFKGSPDVLFELPKIVQCDSLATIAAIQALGIGDRLRPWREQFGYRYLISVDGNGATCSRVAISLKSNSVLIRYNSVNDLYYFRGLEPWVHYVPVDQDDDVVDNIAFLRRHPHVARSLIAQSSDFAETRLSRIAVMHYTAELLRLYIAKFGQPGTAGPAKDLFLIDSFAHVQGHGDVWSQPNGWLVAPPGCSIEGVAFIPGPHLDRADLAYRAIDADGLGMEEARAGRLSGSRGDHRPIHGFAIRLTGNAAARFDLRYEARFADGTHTGPVPSGKACVAPSRAPLTAYRLITAERSSGLTGPA